MKKKFRVWKKCTCCGYKNSFWNFKANKVVMPELSLQSTGGPCVAYLSTGKEYFSKTFVCKNCGSVIDWPEGNEFITKSKNEITT